MDFDTTYASQEVTPDVAPDKTPDAIEAIRLMVARGTIGKNKRVMVDLPEKLSDRLDRQADSLGLSPGEYLKAMADVVLPL